MEHYIPVIATLIAAIVAWTSFQQHQISKAKLKLDLFEKRFSVYKAVEEFRLFLKMSG